MADAGRLKEREDKMRSSWFGGRIVLLLFLQRLSVLHESADLALQALPRHAMYYIHNEQKNRSLIIANHFGNEMFKCYIRIKRGHKCRL